MILALPSTRPDFSTFPSGRKILREHRHRSYQPIHELRVLLLAGYFGLAGRRLQRNLNLCRGWQAAERSGVDESHVLRGKRVLQRTGVYEKNPQLEQLEAARSADKEQLELTEMVERTMTSACGERNACLANPRRC